MQLRAMQLCAMYRDFLQPRMGLNGIADLTNTKYLIHKHTQSHIIIMAFSRCASLGFFAHCLRLQPAAPEKTRLCFLLLVTAAPGRVILKGGGHNKKLSAAARLGLFCACLRLQPAAPVQTRLCFLLLVPAAPKRVILMGGGHNKKPSAAARLGLFCALPSLATGCAGADSAVRKKALAIAKAFSWSG